MSCKSTVEQIISSSEVLLICICGYIADFKIPGFLSKSLKPILITAACRGLYTGHLQEDLDLHIFKRKDGHLTVKYLFSWNLLDAQPTTCTVFKAGWALNLYDASLFKNRCCVQSMCRLRYLVVYLFEQD